LNEVVIKGVPIDLRNIRQGVYAVAEEQRIFPNT
jgi:hypothetical protein